MKRWKRERLPSAEQKEATAGFCFRGLLPGWRGSWNTGGGRCRYTGRVRRAVRVEGRSQRAVARDFGLSRETVRKMLQYAVPTGYQRQQPVKRPKLGRGWA